MKIKYAAILGAAIALGSTSVVAQQQAQQTPVCQTVEQFKAFDFWIGKWSVTANGSDQVQGHNTITQIMDGCALLEEWENIQGGKGISTNHFNPITKEWRQLWISGGGGGYSIDYTGGLKDGSMKMEGEIYYYSNKSKLPFRGTWTPNEDGTVRQFFEQYNPETKAWDVWFDGIYTRVTVAE
jgi:hypothetical protein